MKEKVRKVSDAQLAEALRNSGGVMAEAARLIEQATGEAFTRQAVAQRVRLSDDLKDALDDGRESLIDMAETQLARMVREGDQKAVFFVLKTRGRRRGFGDDNSTGDIRTQFHEELMEGLFN